MKPVDVEDDSFAEYHEKSNKNDPKFKIGDHLRISKYMNIFAKRYSLNWSEEIFVVKKIKNSVPWSSSIMGGSDTICKKYFPPFSNPPLISNKETPTHQRSSDKCFIPTRHKNKLLSALTKCGGNNMRP